MATPVINTFTGLAEAACDYDGSLYLLGDHLVEDAWDDLGGDEYNGAVDLVWYGA